ncbi:hydroxyacylglutathione hydrolase [Planctobacterium marinum]|uniref:hydroxyacylglutathione hydrolase n=1 Tax=Planctobacterium marinum TaxID=1631968 RepID=UPI001E441D42|nr:hydroxyacylglutathione hydrolase [Planctobacterium marinum]MCC2607328.1 hydroxyacylglutathione hydrolase [Planctobacterium marinum]
MISVFPIPAFTDNYIWCLHNDTHAVVVDPGDAAPVQAFLQQQQLTLTHILITHHHPDHIGGVAELKKANVTVIGPVSQRIAHIDKAVSEADTILLEPLNIAFQVMEVPAHTREHIAFYGEPGLFCGDTLFSAGCGRLFEGTPQQMHQVLQRYAHLPEHTKVYCTHEYTQANLRFALDLLPDDEALLQYATQVNQLRQQNTPTLPTTIAREKKVNPYLRVSERLLAEAVQRKTGALPDNDTETFAAVRHLKDQF